MSVRSLGLVSVANSLAALSSPVEIRLRKKRLDVTADAEHEDEATEPLRVKSVSMRGAQREITTHMKGLGYLPVTSWSGAEQVAGALESRRVFRFDG